MDKIEMIDVDDFMALFIAISYLQEQRIINIENVKNYLHTFYNTDDNTINEINKIVGKMETSGMIERIPNYEFLYKISNKIPFKEIVFDNQEYLEEMVKFFYSFNNCSIPNIRLISEQEESNNLKKR